MRKCLYKSLAVITSVLTLVLGSCNMNPDYSPAEKRIEELIKNRVVNVTFDGNGGKVFTSGKEYKSKIFDVKLGASMPDAEIPLGQRNGYNFLGWNTEKDGSGDDFTNSSIVTDCLTLYAQYEIYDTPLTSIEVDETSVSVPSGSEYVIKGMYSPANATEKINVTVSNGKYLTISSSYATMNNGEFEIVIKGALFTPGATTATVTVKEASGTDLQKSVSVKVLVPEAENVTEINVFANSSDDISSNEFTSMEFDQDNSIYWYQVSLVSGQKYFFQFIDHDYNSNYCDAKFYLFNSSSTVVREADNPPDGLVNYECNADGDYYIAIVPYSSTCTGEVSLRVAAPNVCTNYTVSQSAVSVNEGESVVITVTPTPVEADLSLTCSTSSRNYKVSINGNQVTVTGLMQTIGFTPKFTIKDRYSNRSKDITVSVTKNFTNITEDVLTIYTYGAMDGNYGSVESLVDEFTEFTGTESQPVKTYALTLTAGNTYYFYQNTSGYQTLYKSDEEKIWQYSTYTKGVKKYDVTTTDTYYYSVAGNTLEESIVYRVCCPTIATAIALEESSVSVPVGSTVQVSGSTTPAGAELCFEKNPTITGELSAASTKAICEGGSVYVTSVLPGYPCTVTVKEHWSSLTTTLNVVSTIDTETITNEIVPNDVTDATEESSVTAALTQANTIQFYKLQLDTTKLYFFDYEQNEGEALWCLYNSSMAPIIAPNTADKQNYKVPSTGTYYIAIVRPNINAAAGTNSSMHVYSCNLASSFAISANEITIESGETCELTITPTPADAKYNFQFVGGSDPAWLRTSVEGNKVTVVANQLRGAYSTVLLKDTYTNLQVSCRVYCTQKSTTNITQVLPINLGSYVDENKLEEFTHVSLTDDNPIRWFKVHLEANKNYGFQFVSDENRFAFDSSESFSSSANARLNLFTPGNLEVINMSTDVASTNVSKPVIEYKPAEEGDFYCAIASNTDDYKYAVRCYEVNTITSDELSIASSTNVKCGKSTVLNISYPITKDVKFTVSSNNENSCRVNVIDNKLHIFGMATTGNATVTLNDIYSGVTKTCTVTTSLDSISNYSELTVDTTSSSNINAYTVETFGSENMCSMYKVYMDVGKIYQFQCADDHSYGTVGFSSNEGLIDCKFFLLNSTGDLLISADDEGIITYTPQTSGYRLFAFRPFTNGRAGQGAVHVYKEGISSFSASASTVNLTMTFDSRSSTNYPETSSAISFTTVPAGVPLDLEVYSISGSNYPQFLTATISNNKLNVKAWAPYNGTKTVTVRDKYSGKTTTIDVSVGLTISYVNGTQSGTAPSTNVSDYSYQRLSDTCPYFIWQVTVPSSGDFYIQIPDNDNAMGITSWGSRTRGDCYMYYFNMSGSTMNIINYHDSINSPDGYKFSAQSGVTRGQTYCVMIMRRSQTGSFDAMIRTYTK